MIVSKIKECCPICEIPFLNASKVAVRELEKSVLLMMGQSVPPTHRSNFLIDGINPHHVHPVSVKTLQEQEMEPDCRMPHV